MSLETYSDAVMAQVDTLVPAALTTAQFAAPNTRFSPTRGTPWVTYTMQTLDNSNASMGATDTGSGWRFNEGLVEFRCFVPLNAGADDAAALAEEVAGALRGQTFTGGHFRNLRLVELGADGEWFQYNVIAEFYHQEVA